ncbi:c-type cytochrome [Sulfurospirillum sp. T05]|uniref:C-type cytochrome n=1 Tax=Sulfurospirillum tamanense TaxID=2813362 RepID=A0ABS2WUN5_9BACT|nr:c-type cytochrome [Sulfurospirillum tamanensis]MBN2964899.1 c-type cytochrome [Sulfurospirillum tamanensis]
MKRWIMTLGLLASASLMAADGAALYQKCLSCHGANAEKKALGKSEVIANWSVEKNVAALKGYKDGTYGGPMKALMKGQVANYSDQEIQAVSEYITGLKN